MKQLYWFNWSVQIVLAGIVWIASENSFFANTVRVANAQTIREDATLGGQSSSITPNELIRGILSDRIDGGAQRGANLFHSFEQFDIPRNRGAYFTNPAGVETIFSRVTGGDRSELLGRLGVLGNADLFFINPNGILFGPNASLDVGGSFAATTANAVQFGDRGSFSASAPEFPSDLLTVNPSAFLFDRLGSGTIENTSRAVSRNPVNTLETAGLKVPDGQTLLLVGGDILMNQGRVTVYGGRIELGGLDELGAIALIPDNNSLRLQFPESIDRANVFLNRSTISAFQGNVAINARNLEVMNRSFITVDSLQNIELPGNQPGSIDINVVEAARLIDSNILNNTSSNRVDGGDINITAGTFTVATNSLVSSNTSSSRNGGSLTITTGTLSVTEGSRLSASTFAQGNAGNITVNASELVEVRGISGPSRPSEINARVARSDASGQGGNITIQTRNLAVRDGGAIGTGSFGSGNAGDITIHAAESIDVSGRSPASDVGTIVDVSDDGSLPSFITTQIDRQGTGNGGDIWIETQTLRISGGAAVSAGSFGQGRSDAGNVTVIASNSIEIDGAYEYERNNSPQFRRSGLFTQVGRRIAGDRIEGNAGNVNIETGNLRILNGGVLNSRNSGPGRAGTIEVTANLVEMNGRSSRFAFESVFTAESIGTGDAGNLILTADQLALQDGAQIRAATRSGRGGDVRLQGLRTVQVNNGEISASTQTGQAGSLSIEASEAILLSNNGRLLVQATGNAGAAGNLVINTRDVVLQDGAQISASTTSGQGGNIALQGLDRLAIQNGQISASTQTGTAGTLTIQADTVRLAGETGRLSVAAEGGRAGGLNINTDRLTVQNGAQVTVSSTEIGRAGDLVITADNVILNNQAQLTAETEFGSGGNIQLQILDSLRLSDRSLISASTQGGQGGSLTLNTNRLPANVVQLDNSRFAVQANGDGIAGSINLNAEQVALQNRALISATTVSGQQGGNITLRGLERLRVADSEISASTQTGRAGSLNVNASESVVLRDGGELSVRATRDGGIAGDLAVNTRNLTIQGGAEIAASTASGPGGNIDLTAETISLRSGAQITATTGGQGNAGNITMMASDRFSAINSNVTTAAESSSGGDINLTAGDVRLFGDSDITTNVTSGAGNGGNINFTARSILAFDDSDIIASARAGAGGNITLDTPAFFAQNYQPVPEGTNPDTLDGNDRVDINASGAIAGTITLPDVTFIQNSLTDLPDAAINPETLVANSCIARSQEQGGSFVVTGAGGLPARPGDAVMSSYPTGVVRTVPPAAASTETTEKRPWQLGDAIAEPQGIYQLSNGRLVMSRECP